MRLCACVLALCALSGRCTSSTSRIPGPCPRNRRKVLTKKKVSRPGIDWTATYSHSPLTKHLFQPIIFFSLCLSPVPCDIQGESANYMTRKENKKTGPRRWMDCTLNYENMRSIFCFSNIIVGLLHMHLI